MLLLGIKKYRKIAPATRNLFIAIGLLITLPSVILTIFFPYYLLQATQGSLFFLAFAACLIVSKKGSIVLAAQPTEKPRLNTLIWIGAILGIELLSFTIFLNVLQISSHYMASNPFVHEGGILQGSQLFHQLLIALRAMESEAKARSPR